MKSTDNDNSIDVNWAVNWFQRFIRLANLNVTNGSWFVCMRAKNRSFRIVHVTLLITL